jgi:hypothetical protein
MRRDARRYATRHGSARLGSARLGTEIFTIRVYHQNSVNQCTPISKTYSVVHICCHKYWTSSKTRYTHIHKDNDAMNPLGDDNGRSGNELIWTEIETAGWFLLTQ